MNAKERQRRAHKSPVEQPLRLKAPEVRAILDGATDLRCVVKPQPSEQDATSYLDSYCNAFHTKPNPRAMSRHWCWWSHDHKQIGPDWLLCPYGKPGDAIWVKETFCPRSNGALLMERIQRPFYRATDGDSDMKKPSAWNWRPSTHMPKHFARIRIVITDVRMGRAESGLWEWVATFEGTL